MALRPRPTRGISLFAGAGGLDLGLHRALPGYRSLVYVEREAYAAAVLVARMADASLAQAPVWDDVGTFDGRRWRGYVDLVHGGFPCVDISNAGKRAGIGGERSGLWKQFARIIGECEPEHVFIENVSALRTRGLDVVLKDLTEMGFDAEWGCVRASDIGAPHRRERMFILAHHHHHGRAGIGGGRVLDRIGPALGDHSDGPSGTPVADAERPELRDEPGRGRGASWTGPTLAPDLGEGVVHADGRGDVGGLDDSVRSAVGRVASPWAGVPCEWPPGPDDTEGWAWVLSQRPDLEPSLHELAHGLGPGLDLDAISDRNRLAGNGVVPAQAELAFRTLWHRLHGEPL